MRRSCGTRCRFLRALVNTNITLQFINAKLLRALIKLHRERQALINFAAKFYGAQIALHDTSPRNWGPQTPPHVSLQSNTNTSAFQILFCKPCHYANRIKDTMSGECSMHGRQVKETKFSSSCVLVCVWFWLLGKAVSSHPYKTADKPSLRV